MKFRDLRGVHGLVFEVDDPDREAHRWRRALGLPVLRKGPREIVLGGLSFFVVLRLRQSSGDSSGLTELHVAVDGLSTRRLEEDSLGGRHAALDLRGSRLRLVVRELTGAPSAAWLPRARRRRSRRSTRAGRTRAATKRSRS